MAKKPRFRVWQSGWQCPPPNTGDEVITALYMRNFDDYDIICINDRYFEFTLLHPDGDYVKLGKEYERGDFVKAHRQPQDWEGYDYTEGHGNGATHRER